MTVDLGRLRLPVSCPRFDGIRGARDPGGGRSEPHSRRFQFPLLRQAKLGGAPGERGDQPGDRRDEYLSACGHENREGVRFCEECATALARRRAPGFQPSCRRSACAPCRFAAPTRPHQPLRVSKIPQAPRSPLVGEEVARPSTGTETSSNVARRRRGQARANSTPLIWVRTSIRSGGKPIWNTTPGVARSATVRSCNGTPNARRAV